MKTVEIMKRTGNFDNSQLSKFGIDLKERGGNSNNINVEDGKISTQQTIDVNFGPGDDLPKQSPLSQMSNKPRRTIPQFNNDEHFMDSRNQKFRTRKVSPRASYPIHQTVSYGDASSEMLPP